MQSNPTPTVNLAPGQSLVNNLRAAMQRKSETFSQLLGCRITVGQGVGMVAAAVPAAAALVLVHLAVYGWAATCTLLAVQLAAPGVAQFIKEGGEE